MKEMSMEASKWYDDNIEEPVRDLVFLLRNNGFNTESSCGHKMWVQCQFIMGHDDIMALHKLICSYLYDKKKPVTFKISIVVLVDNGIPMSTLLIDLNPTKDLDTNDKMILYTHTDH